VSECDVVLKRPEEIGEKVPLSLHLLVKNGVSVVGRLFDCVGPYLADVSVTLNDCDDNTREVIESKCKDYAIPRCHFVEVRAATHADLYLLDVPETYRKGRSLVGEVYQGPFTGGKLLADWATARNLSWDACAADWRLFLDADDVLDDPECLPGLCRALDKRGIEVASSRYHYDHSQGGRSRANAFRERLARNCSSIRWHGCVHEQLVGYVPGRVAHVVGSLVARDLRDSSGAGIRVPGRNLKVLYAVARARDFEVTPRHMVYLAAEAKVAMPSLAVKLAEMHQECATWGEEKSWSASILGEIYEEDGDYVTAGRWYEHALSHHAGVMPAMRLARVRFRQGNWEETIAAYQRGLRNRSVGQFLDGSEVYEDATAILVASALRKLGRFEEAERLCAQARAKFPESPSLRDLEGNIRRGAGRKETRG
jgi:tetratricopeptide (TPR) repeat protein